MGIIKKEFIQMIDNRIKIKMKNLNKCKKNILFLSFKLKIHLFIIVFPNIFIIFFFSNKLRICQFFL
jgi:hypothetical protein